MGKGHRTLQDSLLTPRADQILPAVMDQCSLLDVPVLVFPEEKYPLDKAPYLLFPTADPVLSDGTRPGIKLAAVGGMTLIALDTDEIPFTAYLLDQQALKTFVRRALQQGPFVWKFEQPSPTTSGGTIEVSSVVPGYPIHVVVYSTSGKMEWRTALSYTEWASFVQRLHYAAHHNGSLQLNETER